MQLILLFDGKDYWLATTRGLIQVMHPDSVNSLKAAGVPQANVDKGTMDNAKRILTLAP